jgi:hypothetical protein
VLGSTDIYDVLVAIVAAIPATIGALTSLYVVKQIRTPSRTAIGKQVEDNRHVTLANHYLLRSTAKDVGIETPPATERETSYVSDIEPNGEA